MNISQWFITPEELCQIKNLYLLNISSNIMNDFETDEMYNYWKYRQFEDIRKILLTKYQITQNTFVVLYTKEKLMMAARFAWLLYWIGCRQIRILIGKIDPCLYINNPCRLSTLPNVPLRPNVRMICSELLSEFHCLTTEFIDVRTSREYYGEITGYSYIHRAGRIPNFQYDLLDGIYGEIRGDITWNELETYLNMMLITNRCRKTTKRIVYMCGTGWRASLSAIFALELKLAETITVLDSGWFEWSEEFMTNSSLYEINSMNMYVK
ncbi:hypothetical protein I4U23_012981 [Adineta vaga]|nr:hypothetical protein I4U23_012981 [Adineta vaga]